MSDHLYYPSLDAYNADVYAARAAYHEDQVAEQGLCVQCEERKRDKGKRRCWTCRHGGKEWAAERMRLRRSKGNQ